MSKSQKTSDLERILEKLSSMDTKLSNVEQKLVKEISDMRQEMKTEMTILKKDVKDAQQMAEENKKRVGGLEGEVRVIQKREEGRGNAFLISQLEKMSFFLRFQNVPEDDQQDLREVMVKMLAEFTNRELEQMRWDVDLVYRVNSQYAIIHSLPREVHVRFVRRETRDQILKIQRTGGLTHGGRDITILKQIPRQVREMRKRYYFLTDKLYLKGIGFRWLMPEGLMIFGEGLRKKISTVAEATSFLEENKTLLTAESTGVEEGEVLEAAGGEESTSQRKEGALHKMTLRTKK